LRENLHKRIIRQKKFIEFIKARLRVNKNRKIRVERRGRRYFRRAGRMLRKKAASYEKESIKLRHRQRRSTRKAKVLNQNEVELKRLAKKLQNKKSPKAQIKFKKVLRMLHEYKRKQKLFKKEKEARRQQARSAVRKTAKLKMRSNRFKKRQLHKRRFITHPANLRRRIHLFRQKELQFSRRVQNLRRHLMTKMTDEERKEDLKKLKRLMGIRMRARRQHRMLNRRRGRGQAKSRRARRGLRTALDGHKSRQMHFKRRSEYERHISRGITHSRRSRRHFFRANRFTRRAEYQQKRAKHLRMRLK
jgi:hypothetical protein